MSELSPNRLLLEAVERTPPMSGEKMLDDVEAMKRPKKKVTDDEVRKLLAEAKKESFFDYVALKTMIALGLRRAELVGQDDLHGRMRKRLDKDGQEWYFTQGSHPNPGLLIENLTPTGIWFRRKKQQANVEVRIDKDLRSEINQIIGRRKTDRIFPRSTDWVLKRVRHYAKKANLPDADKIWPHRLLAWATTRVAKGKGIVVARDFRGHSSIAVTNTYLDESEPEDIEQASQSLLETIGEN